VQGDDYIMYCHPQKQKNPRASHLREWYHKLLDAAARRCIVSFRSTLFDAFFPGGRDHALTSVTARNLPYFDGDFWPGEAETQLANIASGKTPAGARCELQSANDTSVSTAQCPASTLRQML
jgi:E1A/CREB-binding protein